MAPRSWFRWIIGLGTAVGLAFVLVNAADTTSRSCGCAAPEGYSCKIIYSGLCPGLCAITRCPDGTIFGQCKGKASVGIVWLDMAGGKVTPHRLKLPKNLQDALSDPKRGDYGNQVSRIVGGPGQTLYLKVHSTLYKLSGIDLKTCVAKNATEYPNFNGQIVASVGCTLIGFRQDAKGQHVLYRWDAGGLGEERAAKSIGGLSFTEIADIAVCPGEGISSWRFLVTCRPTKSTIQAWLVATTSSGSGTSTTTWAKRRILAENLKNQNQEDIVNDPIYAAYSSNEHAFFVRTMQHFLKVDPTTGKADEDFKTPIATPYSRSPCQFVFVGKPNKDEEALFVDATDSQIVHVNLRTGNTTVALSSEGSNSPAIAVDTTGKFFAGSKGLLFIGIAADPILIRVLKPGAGAKTIVATYKLTGYKGEVRDLAFEPSGALYATTLDPDGKTSRILRVTTKKSAGVIQAIVQEVAKMTGNNFLSLAVIGNHRIRATATTVRDGKPSALQIREYTIDEKTGKGTPQKTYTSTVEFWTKLGAEAQYITEFRIVFHSKSTYALITASRTESTTDKATRWIAKLDLKKGTAPSKGTMSITRATKLDEPSLKTTEVTGNLSIDTKGELWLLLSPSPFELRYSKAPPTAKVNTFTNSLPIDPAGVVSYYDGAGGHHVYVTSPQGIHHFSKPKKTVSRDKGIDPGGQKLTPDASKNTKAK